MNKKIIFSGLSVASALTLLVGAAYAAFVVSATSNGSTFSSGNPSLALCNDNAGVMGTCANQIPSPINITKIVPGVSQSFAFWIQNTGTDTLDTMTAVFNNPTGSGLGSSNALEADLSIVLTCDAISNSAHTTNSKFNIWESNKSLTGGTLASGAASRCVMTVSLPSTNTTDANQTLNFNAVFSASDGS